MRAKIAVFLCILLMIPAFALANVPEMTVEQVINSAFDDQIVSVTGVITKQVKHDKFIFKDDTGTILMEIDEEDWPQYNTPVFDKKLNIICEVEKDHKITKLEAKKVTIL
ncbi:NirD/YgiW/YdeI family stress tolerance protein [Selenomonadales bacterium OttesenSCG-928-I06]|nr:NirD/YgiW/YdeI family stress tolerance protein [Selenomonadales bacterium OttesenSCG-928-I06]